MAVDLEAAIEEVLRGEDLSKITMRVARDKVCERMGWDSPAEKNKFKKKIKAAVSRYISQHDGGDGSDGGSTNAASAQEVTPPAGEANAKGKDFTMEQEWGLSSSEEEDARSHSKSRATSKTKTKTKPKAEVKAGAVKGKEKKRELDTDKGNAAKKSKKTDLEEAHPEVRRLKERIKVFGMKGPNVKLDDPEAEEKLRQWMEGKEIPVQKMPKSKLTPILEEWKLQMELRELGNQQVLTSTRRSRGRGAYTAPPAQASDSDSDGGDDDGDGGDDDGDGGYTPKNTKYISDSDFED